MTAVPTAEARHGHDASPDAGGGLGGLAPRAQIYLVVVLAIAATCALPLIANLDATRQDWLAFCALAGGAAVAQLFVVRTPRNQSYHTAIVFVVAAVILLPPELIVLLGLVQHIPEWLKVRYPWYIQSFNIANYTVDALAAWGAATLAAQKLEPFAGSRASWALFGLVASLVFVGLNHTLLAGMLHFARGHTLRETGLFSTESLVTDLVLAGLGVAVAGFWQTNPWLVPVAIAPLVLIHRSLSVPALKEEARIDPKTGLFNARHFAAALRDELARSERFERPMAVIMADLDLLREVNNAYGHLAGDAVLGGVAEVFRRQLRPYDIPARFGGEEFAVLLPETTIDQALEIAERVRRAVAGTLFEVETSSEPIRATLSVGVAAFPQDGLDANELIHQADLAVYRAKLQGRNRVLGASHEPLVDRENTRLEPVAEESVVRVESVPVSTETRVARVARPQSTPGPRFLSLSPVLGAFVAAVCLGGIAAGVAGLVLGREADLTGLLGIIVFVTVGQALAVESSSGSISVSVVGTLAGVALCGPRAVLPLALAVALVEWSARRDAWFHVLFNIGALTLAGSAAAALFALEPGGPREDPLVTAGLGLLAGGLYFLVNTGLLSVAMALEGHDSVRDVWNERFAWLLPHYVAFGAIGAAIAVAYDAIGLYALAVFVLPLLLARKTMATYLGHTERSARKLRDAAETIRSQNVSLELANRLLRERSTAAMESLSATVDARDAYTAGHSRRVQRLALLIGEELGLSRAELDVLGYAALFHDIGKLAVPDSVLLKPAGLSGDEWNVMRRHADEGARIIDRLGFLQDAVPAIRHHHERFDGSGYPDGLAGEDIPLGARIIHVADALDSMLTTRIYRAARPAEEALDELRRATNSQFCPRCIAALERALGVAGRDGEPSNPRLFAAS